MAEKNNAVKGKKRQKISANFEYGLVLFLTFACFTPYLQAQHFHLEDLSSEVKISSDHINSILQDSQGFLWIGTANGLNRFDGYDVRIFKNELGNTNSLSNNVVQDIIEDHEGMLWIATDGGLNKFDPRTENFQHFRHNSDDPNSINSNRVRAVYEDHHYNLWIGTVEGLNKLDRAATKFTNYPHPFPRMHPWDDVQDIRQIEGYIVQDKPFLILAYWGSGAMKFNIETTEFSRIERLASESSVLEWPYIYSSDEKELYVVDEQSVFKYNDLKKGLEAIEIRGIDKDNIPNLESIYKHQNTILLGAGEGKLLQIDLEGNILMQETIDTQTQNKARNRTQVSAITKGLDDEIWIGTKPAGIKKLDFGKNKFRTYQHHLEKYRSILDNNIYTIVESKPNTFIVGTYFNEMFQFDLAKEQFSAPFQLEFQNDYWPEKVVKTLFKDSKNQLLVGSFGGGLAYLEERTNVVTPLSENYSINDTKIRFINSIQEISSGEIWLGTYEGILVLPIDSLLGDSHKVFSDRQEQGGLSHSDVFNILEDHKERVWVGTEAGGLNRWSKNAKQFTHFRHDIYHPNSISSDNIINIFEDSQQRLWISTLNGLNLWKEETQNFSHFTEFPELQEEVVQGFKEDKQGNLWMTTKQSLIRFHPEQKTLLRFDEQDGLLNTAFNPDAFAESSVTGHFLIGGKNGITVFHPDSIRKNDFIPRVYITALRRHEAEKEELVEKGMSWKDHLSLSYKNTILTFEFTALNYRNSKQNRYAYQLEGFNDNWIDIGTKREVTFTNLPPGTYHLNVKGANNDGQPTSLQITITPPWWKTRIAYFLYGLLSLGLLYLIYRFLLHRQSLNHQLQIEQAEAQRLKELDSFKNRLYTNLTHEFRTPLTVILGMTQQIRSKPKQFLDSGTQLIERNGKNLLRLINQLLDLSKLEGNSFQLHLQQGDVVSYLRYLTESFQTYANSQNLSLQFLSTLESLQMDYDPEQLQQVITNLLSNAVKYTPSGGAIKVKVTQERQQLFLSIQDTGIGITTTDLPHIFDRFYQVDNSTTRTGEGTGIGLAHTRELVKLMGGEIKVESQVGKGSVFSILLPITNNAIASRSELSVQESEFLSLTPLTSIITNIVPENKELPQLLLIEDNPDVVTYLKVCLQHKYQIDVAYNGKIGIEKAFENIPDLIISDVMMPEKDGYEVCDTLKNDERTSHIPITLLTAKADGTSKIVGLRRGADAYLAKPFDQEELLVRLEMMMEKQRKLAAYFSQNNTTLPTEEDLQIEHEFIQKIRNILENNYTNDRFGLPQLCQKTGMSRSQLYRKMKALINTSPSDFIRTYRLEQAKKLLETTELNVSEVAWEVGFTSLPHFSKIFHEEFGFAPSATNK